MSPRKTKRKLDHGEHCPARPDLQLGKTTHRDFVAQIQFWNSITNQSIRKICVELLFKAFTYFYCIYYYGVTKSPDMGAIVVRGVWRACATACATILQPVDVL